MHQASSRRTLIAAAVAAALTIAYVPAHAGDAASTAKVSLKDLGFELWGYMRSGFYAGTQGEPTGQYQLGGPLDHYRLGNEGDNYIEIGIGKKTDLGGGLKWGVYWMPTVYNGGTGTAQVYSDITGLDIAPTATFWGGQRYHRIQDVHILDNWLMQDGDNYGAGVDDLDIGLGKLNLALLRVMMARALGSSIEGDVHQNVDAKITASATPFALFLDEFAYQFAEGIALTAAQARSLNFFLCALAQDLEKLTEGDRAADQGQQRDPPEPRVGLVALHSTNPSSPPRRRSRRIA